MWIVEFPKHKKIKKKLLSLIDEMPSGDTVKSDWDLPKEYNRKYLNLFYKEIFDLMLEVSSKFYCDSWEIYNAWFAQYSENDKHNWHTHPLSNLSAVYYLELPKKELVTEFKGKFKPKVKEGDILFFPSYMMHRSPINKSNKRKTVIAFNCDFRISNIENIDFTKKSFYGF